MAMPVVTTTKNHDVLGVYNLTNRFIEEMWKCVSSSASQMNEFDQIRLISYLANLRGYLNWVEAQPHLDLPETSPAEWPLKPIPPITNVENEEVNNILILFSLTRDELINSQSARISSGMIPFDMLRIRAIIDKVEAFLVKYVQPLTPLDLPESSPQAPVSGPGRTGV